MPQFDRIFTLPNGTDMWGARMLTSPLATVGASIVTAQGRIRPSQTVTIRVRFREDIETNTVITDEQGRNWFVAEVLEIGRRRFLDVGMSFYAPIAVPTDTPDPNPPAPTDPWTPPAYWGMTFDGDPIRSLEIDTIVISTVTRRSGTFVLPSGTYAGMLTPNNSDVLGRIRRTQNVCKFALLDTSGEGIDLLNNGFYALTFGEIDGAIVTEYSAFADSSLALATDVVVSPGDVIDLASADEFAEAFGG